MHKSMAYEESKLKPVYCCMFTHCTVFISMHVPRSEMDLISEL